MCMYAHKRRQESGRVAPVSSKKKLSLLSASRDALRKQDDYPTSLKRLFRAQYLFLYFAMDYNKLLKDTNAQFIKDYESTNLTDKSETHKLYHKYKSYVLNTFSTAVRASHNHPLQVHFLDLTYRKAQAIAAIES